MYSYEYICTYLIDSSNIWLGLSVYADLWTVAGLGLGLGIVFYLYLLEKMII